MSGLHVEEKYAICSSLALINALEANDLAISLHGDIICLGHTLTTVDHSLVSYFSNSPEG